MPVPLTATRRPQAPEPEDIACASSASTRNHIYTRTYHPGCMSTEWEQLFHVANDPYLTRNLLDEEPELADRMRAHLSQWWHKYAGRPGSLPDPMQATLQTGPTYYSDPVRYRQHLRDTGRAHLADDLDRRLESLDIPVSWHAPDQPRTGKIADRMNRTLQGTGGVGDEGEWVRPDGSRGFGRLPEGALATQ